jgi:hypothetical protein
MTAAKWRQGGKVPHHVYVQRGEEPDRRPWPDGDPPIGMFLNPEDAELACTAVNAARRAAFVTGPRPDRWEPREVRISPDRFVAQRLDRDFNGHGNWILTFLGEYGIELKVLDDEAVAGWPRLSVQLGESS